MANRVWYGAAVPIPQVDEITVADTWATNDTATITINGKDLTLTVGTTATIAVILDNLLVMVTGTGTFGAGYSSNTTGNLVGEFAKLTATEDGSSKLTITGPSTGEPFALTTSETTAGDGTLSESTVTTGTGPEYFSNADNWSGDAVPIDADVVIFDHRAAASCKYGLAQTAVAPATVIVTDGFAYEIGLPDVNTYTSSLPYDEANPTYLAIGTTGDSITVNIEASKSGRIKIDTGDASGTVVVTDTGRRADSATPSFLWKGTATGTNSVTVNKGDVGIAFGSDETATLATLYMGYVTNQQGDANVICGIGTTLATVTKHGGSLETNAAVTTVHQTAGDWTHTAGNITTINLDGGDFYLLGGSVTITNLNGGSGGVAHYGKDTRGNTITNVIVTAGFGWDQPTDNLTLTNGIDAYRCSLTDLSPLVLPAHKTWTPSSI